MDMAWGCCWSVGRRIWAWVSNKACVRDMVEVNNVGLEGGYFTTCNKCNPVQCSYAWQDLTTSMNVHVRVCPCMFRSLTAMQMVSYPIPLPCNSGACNRNIGVQCNSEAKQSMVLLGRTPGRHYDAVCHNVFDWGTHCSFNPWSSLVP